MDVRDGISERDDDSVNISSTSPPDWSNKIDRLIRLWPGLDTHLQEAAFIYNLVVKGLPGWIQCNGNICMLLPIVSLCKSNISLYSLYLLFHNEINKVISRRYIYILVF